MWRIKMPFVEKPSMPHSSLYLLDVSVHLGFDDLFAAPEDAGVFAEPAVLLFVDIQLASDHGCPATSAAVDLPILTTFLFVPCLRQYMRGEAWKYHVRRNPLV